MENKHQGNIFLALVVGFFIGYIISSFSQGGHDNTETEGADTFSKSFFEIKETDHVRGSRNADIIIVEYSDFECPFCARFHPTAKQSVEESNGKVAWVYRHLPLESIHQNARYVASVSECVADIGNEEFWGFADDIFSAGKLNRALIDQIAAQYGLNKTSLDSCVESKRKIVDEHLKQARILGISGTPGGFIFNRKDTEKVAKLQGAIPYGELQRIISELE